MKLSGHQYAASIFGPMIACVYFICEWSATFGHGPYGYEPMVRWPFSCVFCIASGAATIYALINIAIEEDGSGE